VGNPAPSVHEGDGQGGQKVLFAGFPSFLSPFLLHLFESASRVGERYRLAVEPEPKEKCGDEINGEVNQVTHAEQTSDSIQFNSILFV